MWTPPGLLDMCPALTSSNTGDDRADLIAGIVLGEHNKRGRRIRAKQFIPQLCSALNQIYKGLNTNQN